MVTQKCKINVILNLVGIYYNSTIIINTKIKDKYIGSILYWSQCEVETYVSIINY